MQNVFDSVTNEDSDNVFDGLPDEPEDDPNATAAENAAQRLTKIDMSSLTARRQRTPAADTGPIPLADLARAGLTVGSTLSGAVQGGIAGLANLGYQGAIDLFGGEPDYDRPPELAREMTRRGAEAVDQTPGSRRALQEVGEFAGDVGTIGKAIVSPVVGAMAMRPGGESPTEAMSEFIDTPIQEYMGEKAYQAAGAEDNPKLAAAMATAATILPDTALAVLGLRRMETPDTKAQGIDVPRGPGDIPTRESFIRELPETGPGGELLPLAREREDLGPQPRAEDGSPTPEEMATVEEAVRESARLTGTKAGKAEKLIEVMDPDPEMVAAFEELGIDAWTPAMVARASGVRETYAPLKSQQKALRDADEAVRDELNEKAAQLIEELEASDVSAIEATLKNNIDDVRIEYQNLADEAYEGVLQSAALKRSLVTPDLAVEVFDYLANRIADLGGDMSKLSRAERQLYDTFYREGLDGSPAPATPTYEAVNTFRELIGKEMSGEKIFADSKQGELDTLYGLLSGAQHRAAEAFSPEAGAKLLHANKLVETRKDFEAQSRAALGRNLEGSIVPKIAAAATALTRGNVSHLDKLMKNLGLPKTSAWSPTIKQTQQDIAAAILNRLLFTTKKGTAMSESAVSNWKALHKNKVARDALFQYLPADVIKNYNTIMKAAEGFFFSIGKDNMSRSAVDIIAAINKGGLSNTMTSIGTAEAGAAVVGLPTGSGVVLKGVTAMAKKAPDNAEKATTFLLSNEAKVAVRTYVTGQAERAQQILSRSKKYIQWVDSMPPNQQQRLKDLGFFGWLLDTETQTETDDG